MPLEERELRLDHGDHPGERVEAPRRELSESLDVVVEPPVLEQGSRRVDTNAERAGRPDRLEDPGSERRRLGAHQPWADPTSSRTEATPCPAHQRSRPASIFHGARGSRKDAVPT